jgi:hypothetical protein
MTRMKYDYAGRRACLLAAAASFIALFLFSAALAQERTAPPQAIEWTKVACGSGDAHLLPPAGFTANCFEGTFEKAQGIYDCRLNNASFGSPTEGTEPHFFARARYPTSAARGCGTIGFPNAAMAMRRFHPFLESQAANWSGIETVRDDLQIMFFDAKDHARDGRCFSFIKNGPPQPMSKGHAFTIFGFFCKAPDQAIDTTAAATLVDQIKLTP